VLADRTAFRVAAAAFPIKSDGMQGEDTPAEGGVTELEEPHGGFETRSIARKRVFVYLVHVPE
jgi:hypothetical protein